MGCHSGVSLVVYLHCFTGAGGNSTKALLLRPYSTSISFSMTDAYRRWDKPTQQNNLAFITKAIRTLATIDKPHRVSHGKNP